MPFLLLTYIRQCDPESRSRSVAAFQGQLSTVDFDSPARDRQSQAGSSAILTRSRPVCPVETIKDTGTHIDGNAGTGVADIQHGHALCGGGHANADPPADRAVFDCVVDEV